MRTEVSNLSPENIFPSFLLDQLFGAVEMAVIDEMTIRIEIKPLELN